VLEIFVECGVSLAQLQRVPRPEPFAVLSRPKKIGRDFDPHPRNWRQEHPFVNPKKKLIALDPAKIQNITAAHILTRSDHGQQIPNV
jgi:hypothetical protein